MSAITDIVKVSVRTLGSMLRQPVRAPERAWSSEFTFRLAKRLIDDSKQQPVTWLRERQAVLKLLDTDLLKVRCNDEIIAGVSCLSVEPKDSSAIKRCIVYFHGGGYVVGSTQSYRLTLAKIALASEAKVIGVDYRLAPEHRIPAAQEDCLLVAEALIAAEPDLPVVLMGDSAGGALCLATLNGLANADLHRSIDACVLISPWLSPLDSSVLSSENEETDILDREITEHWKQNFYLHSSQATHVDMMEFDPAILPRLYIQAAGAEVFIAQIDDFVARLEQSHKEYRYEVFPGQFHVFQTFAPLVREAQAAIDKIGAFLKSE